VRKHLAEERRKVVVDRIRKKQEEEERKLKEAELERNRIVEEKERLKRVRLFILLNMPKFK